MFCQTDGLKKWLWKKKWSSLLFQSKKGKNQFEISPRLKSYFRERLELESYHDLEKIKEYGFIKLGKNEKNSIEKILKNLFIK